MFFTPRIVPSSQQDPKQSSGRIPSPTVLVISVSLLLCLVVWWTAFKSTQARINERYSRQCTDVMQRMRERIYAYEHMLLGAKALVQEHPDAGMEIWQAFCQSIELDRSFPGAMAVGYTRRVPNGTLGAFEEQYRRLQSPAFTIWPTHKRDEIHGIVAIHPMQAANVSAIGYDMMTEPTRRAAMKRARDSGNPAISGGVRINEDHAQITAKGFILFVPVYTRYVPLESPQDRRAALQGFVFCFFNMESLLGDLTRSMDQQIDFEVFDMPEAHVKHRLFSSNENAGEHAIRYSTQVLSLFGRDWHLRFHARKELASHYERFGSWYLGLGLCIFNALVATTLLSLRRQHSKALLMAREMTSHLAERTADQKQHVERFQKLTRHLPGLLFQLRRQPNQSLSIPYASDGLRQIFHISPEAAAEDSNRVLSLIHPADLTDVMKSLHLSAEQLGSWQQQFRIRHEDGHERWVYAIATPEREDDQKVLWHGFMTDISALKAAEQKAHDALSELSVQKFAIDQHAMVELVDPHGTITYVNDRFLAITGYPREDLLGQTHRMINSGHHTREFFRDMYQTLQAGTVWHGEICNRAKDGSVFWVDTTIVPVLRDDGKPERFVAIRTDITQRKLLETSLAHARDQAYEASRLKSEFLASMSHEIRTPMNAILGMSSLLLESKLEEKQQEMTRILRGSAESLMRIINDILDFSRIESGKLHIDASTFDLNTILRQSFELLAHRAKEKGIGCTLQLDPHLTKPLIGDPGRIAQVLTNLLGNAIKFTEQGEVRVCCNLIEDKGHALHFNIAVSDTGIGINEDSQGRIFQPFIQADGSTTRRFGGSGLGLAISRQLLELMGGSISFLSVPGKGSTFSFELTLPIGRTEDLLTEPTLSNTVVEHTPGMVANKLTLLVAEDNPANQIVIRYLLKDMGFDHDLATNGRQALAKLQHAPYDAILMDCQMPELDGYSATRLIREGEAGVDKKRIPIIALTAYAMKGDREKCLEAGMDDYVSKPISKEALLEALGRCGLLAAKTQDADLEKELRTEVAPAKAAETSAPGFLECFDPNQWNTLRQLPGKDGQSALDEIIALFLQHTPPRIEQLKTQIEENNHIEAQRTAHTIAGSAASLGAVPLRKTALQLELCLKQGSAEAVPTLLQELSKCWTDCLQHLKKEQGSPL